VKFLVDNQLPRALAVYLRRKGMDCQHVLDCGLAEASDAELRKYATADGRVIVSKDEDFLYLASQPRAKFQLLWVRLGNCRKAALLAAFENAWPKVEVSLRAGDRVVEIR
jgi:predicted nuclease of predicted toxin-antitoxin system